MASFASSYIPTLAASVTRSADVASVNTLSPWFNATEGTLYVDYKASGSSYPTAIWVNSSNYIGVVAGTSGETFQVRVSGAEQAGIGTRTLTGKVAAAYKVNDFAVSNNGGTVATDTSGSLPSGLTTLGVGSLDGSTLPINGCLRRIAYYPRRLTNAELVALTA